MTPVAAVTIEVLKRAGLDLGPGLTDTQIAEIEAAYGFTFNRDHADVLRHVTPMDWVDWLGDEQTIRDGLDWPIEGVLFDVERAFWMAAWGERPASKVAAIELARRHLIAAPKFVPTFSHRYIPASPAPSRSPVFSAYQTDVIYYGTDLADYCAHEFLGEAAGRTHHHHIDFWSDLVEGVGGTQFW